MKNDFSDHELKWLEQNKKIAASINESLEDNLNTNSLENGEPDLEPYNTALLAAKITIDVSEKGLLKGPYDEAHYHYIIKHITTKKPAESASNKFWPLFDFHCACYKEELENEPPERIYMEALIELLRIHHELELNDDMKNEPIFDVNTQALKTIKGNGVYAEFV